MSKSSLLLLLLWTSLLASGQTGLSSKASDKLCGPKHLDRCFLDLAHDQAGIWTSPFRMKPSDALWFVPFAGATGAAVYFDADLQRNLGVDQDRIDKSRKIARFGWPFPDKAFDFHSDPFFGFWMEREKMDRPGKRIRRGLETG